MKYDDIQGLGEEEETEWKSTRNIELKHVIIKGKNDKWEELRSEKNKNS